MSPVARLIRIVAAGAIVVVVVVLAVYFSGVLDGDEGGAPGIEVRDVAMSAQLNDLGQALNPSLVFPPRTPRIHLVLQLAGAELGTEVVGHWYVTEGRDIPPEGREIDAAGITLDASHINEGLARVQLSLSPGPNGFPTGGWLVRVYARGELIRTVAFVITGSTGAGVPAPPPAASSPTPVSSPAPTRPPPRTQRPTALLPRP